MGLKEMLASSGGPRPEEKEVANTVVISGVGYRDEDFRGEEYARVLYAEISYRLPNGDDSGVGSGWTARDGYWTYTVSFDKPFLVDKRLPLIRQIAIEVLQGICPHANKEKLTFVCETRQTVMQLMNALKAHARKLRQEPRP